MMVLHQLIGAHLLCADTICASTSLTTIVNGLMPERNEALAVPVRIVLRSYTRDLSSQQLGKPR